MDATAVVDGNTVRAYFPPFGCCVIVPLRETNGSGTSA